MPAALAATAGLQYLMSPAAQATGRTKRRGDRGDASGVGGNPSKGNIPGPRLGVERPLGVPQFVRRTLVLSGLNGPTGTTGAYGEFFLTLNDAYNGGTSAAGYSKYMAFYSKCFVVGARVLYKFANTTASKAPVVVMCTITTNTSSLSTAKQAIDNGYCDWRVVSSSPDNGVLQHTVDTGRYLHKSKVLDDPQLFSTASAGPAQVIVAHIGVQDPNAAGTVSVTGSWEVEYSVVLTDPIPFV